jgi:2,3-bisphosphoglycerate-independent phosphoglycerate mutase
MVPCFAINTGIDTIENGKLGDIAPTILQIMGVEIPMEMTGEILIK